jgi:hypothetical protein
MTIVSGRSRHTRVNPGDCIGEHSVLSRNLIAWCRASSDAAVQGIGYLLATTHDVLRVHAVAGVEFDCVRRSLRSQRQPLQRSKVAFGKSSTVACDWVAYINGYDVLPG